jgi:hypothetical protein
VDGGGDTGDPGGGCLAIGDKKAGRNPGGIKRKGIGRDRTPLVYPFFSFTKTPLKPAFSGFWIMGYFNPQNLGGKRLKGDRHNKTFYTPQCGAKLELAKLLAARY